MARSFSEILQSVGIGVKGDIQKQREATPGMKWVGTRSGGAYADIKAQEEINRQAGVTLRRFDGKLKSGEKLRNIGGVTYVVPAPSAAPVEPSTPYTPQSFNPQVEGVQALSPFGMFGTEFTPLEDRAQPETVKDVVKEELKKVQEEKTTREESPYGYGLLSGAGFKTEPRKRTDLRTRETSTSPSDATGNSFFYMDQIGKGAPDAAVIAGLNTGEDSQEDATKYGYRAGESLKDRTGRSSGMDLLAGLLDIKGKAGAETPEQQARADAAEEVKNELIQKQFIAQELVDAGIIDRRQVTNPVNQEKIDSVYQARKIIDPAFMESARLETERLSRKVPGDRFKVPETRQYTDSEGNFIPENIPDPFGGTTEGLFFNEEPSRYMKDFEESARKQRVQEKDRLAARGGEAVDDYRLRKFDERDAEQELMELGEAMGIDTTELPAEVVSPPAIERVVKEPVTYGDFGEVIESKRAQLLREPVISKAIETIGMNTDEWEAYTQGIADIESSGGKYTVTSGKHWGKYQMNDDARADAAETMGIDNPTKREFLENPELQERMFAEYTRRNYLHLMQKSPEFRAMSEKEKYSTLARAQLGAEALRKTLAGLTPDKIDANKTKSSKFKDSVEKRFKDLSDNRGDFEGTGEF
jgi:hypothetical protein